MNDFLLATANRDLEDIKPETLHRADGGECARFMHFGVGKDLTMARFALAKGIYIAAACRRRFKTAARRNRICAVIGRVMISRSSCEFSPEAAKVNHYPASRMAVGRDSGTLLRHITAKCIAMTAPVQMEFTEEATGELAQESMAFLYGSPQLGKLGAAGAVRVVDDAPMKVVSIGMRGSRSDDAVTDAVLRLSRWLRANPEYEAAGGFRVMGYNRPFVPRAEQYHEVQLPLRESPVEALTPVIAPLP